MISYKVNGGQTIFDVVTKTILDINSVYSFIKLNNIPDIISDIVGATVLYDAPIIVPPTITATPPPSAITEKNFSSIPNQSVYDIVLQTYFDLNLTYKLITESKFSNLLIYPIPNTLFKFNPTLVRDKSFASYLSKKGIIINSVNGQRAANTNYLLQEDGFKFDLEDGSGAIKLE